MQKEQEPPKSRGVSFNPSVNESTAYKEHNPPSLLRKSSALHPVEPTPTPSTKEKRRMSTKPRDVKDELHILLAVTGSVASIKLPLIVRKLKQIYHERAMIKVIATNKSMVFFDPKELPKDVKLLIDEHEWASRNDDPEAYALHINLRRWADVLLVAPCSANTLSKFAYGICDNLLTTVFRTWNPALPVFLAPAMNTFMYTNPVTKRHFAVIKEFYPFVEILKPVEKVLVCGDIGMGGMREWTDVVETLVSRLEPDEEPSNSDEEDDED